jgi:hypothetical protein
MEVARVCDQCFGKVAEGPRQRRSREYACQWWKRELVEVSSDGHQHWDLLTKRLEKTLIERRGGEHVFVWVDEESAQVGCRVVQVES